MTENLLQNGQFGRGKMKPDESQGGSFSKMAGERDWPSNVSDSELAS